MSEDFRLTDHAKTEQERRGISDEVLDQILTQPEQIVDTHSGRKTYQSRIEIEGKLYIVRAIIEGAHPKTVITVYRSSKVEKYWRHSDESDL